MPGQADTTGPHVYGETVDDHTRCVHYATPADVVAIQFHCCRRFYPCYQCHAAAEPHPATAWPESEYGQPAILCGVCRTRFSILRYRAGHACPSCAAPFNDGCRLHARLYFAS
ncbi:MAG: CHY zinc finger protein [Cryobacterium sp.]